MPSTFKASCRPTVQSPAAVSCPGATAGPDAVRDDVLARLLALNAERYEEEVAMGLHSKAGKTAAAPAAGGKRMKRQTKALLALESEQIGLLF